MLHHESILFSATYDSNKKFINMETRYGDNNSVQTLRSIMYLLAELQYIYTCVCVYVYRTSKNAEKPINSYKKSEKQGLNHMAGKILDP